ncbi:MAG TPA: DoxX family protein [Noviherbaspirillum sp.]|jgi:putative oxidoreductase|uniref:DoxX family protein n=1 Tax=Noviherbaspirillum sp. TaxID=1926288 RepID=UPI002DDD9852|nr:DoxX family protein [Noviherbaspirillum sp.]HEV2610198.1 DoxX family protein [Noviherbaspirillum sp.]
MIDERFAPYAATLLRLSLATMWITHALLKLLVFTIAGFEGYLASQGMPTFIAVPVVALEIAGGILIALGFHGRIASLALLPILAGATLAHAANGWVFSNANGGWEYPVFLIAMSLVHALLGDGAFALKPAAAPATSIRLKTA